MSWEILLAAATNLVAISIWGSRLESKVSEVREDVLVLKQALGFANGGTKSAFIRRDEAMLLYEEVRRRMDKMEDI